MSVAEVFKPPQFADICVLFSLNMQIKESYIGPEEIIRKKSEFLIPCVYHFYQEPVQMVRGEGQYLFDHSGKKYLDFSSQLVNMIDKGSAVVAGVAIGGIVVSPKEIFGQISKVWIIYKSCYHYIGITEWLWY